MPLETKQCIGSNKTSRRKTLSLKQASIKKLFRKACAFQPSKVSAFSCSVLVLSAKRCSDIARSVSCVCGSHCLMSAQLMWTWFLTFLRFPDNTLVQRRQHLRPDAPLHPVNKRMPSASARNSVKPSVACPKTARKT